MNSVFLLFLFLGEIIAVYFLSRMVIQKAYVSLIRIGSRQMIVGILSILYVPGTIVHELSHYFVALLLNMHPQEVSIFPVIDGHKVRLGHVLYHKNKGDFIRPILVGIAPIFGAMSILLLIVYTNQFPGTELWHTIIFGYFILTITASMFSSPQDLIDIGYLIPLGIIIGGLLYLFPLSISPQYIAIINNAVIFFIYALQPALLFSLGFHAILVLVLSRLA